MSHVDGTGRKARWGLLSTARNNRHIIAALHSNDLGEVVAVASRSVESAAAYASNFHILRAFGTYEELLSATDIDAVYIALPNHLHREWVLKALAAGKHVLCEKPLALTVRDVEDLYVAAEHAGLALVEGYMFLHTDLFATLRSVVIEERRLGTPISLHSEFAFNIRDRPGHRTLPAAEGGGCVWDLGGYMVALCCALMGSVPSRGGEPLCRFRDDVPMTAQLGLEFPGGVLASLHASFEGPARSSLSIVGTEGVLSVDNPFKPSESSKITIVAEDPNAPWDAVAERKQSEIIVQETNGRLLYKGEVDALSRCCLAGPRSSLVATTTKASKDTSLATVAVLQRFAKVSPP